MPEQITYAYFCTLGGIAHGRTFTRVIRLNGWYMHTEYYLSPK